MPQAFVEEAAIHHADVVAEVARRAGDQIGRGGRRIGERPVRLGEQTHGLQRREQRAQAIGCDTGRTGERGEIGRAARDSAEEIEVARGEQGLRGDEAVGQRRDLAHVVEWLDGHEQAPSAAQRIVTTTRPVARRSPIAAMACPISAIGTDQADMRAELARRDQRHDRLLGLARRFGLAMFPGAGEDSHHREILQQRQVHGELRHFAGDEADRHQAATPSHRPRELLG